MGLLRNFPVSLLMFVRKSLPGPDWGLQSLGDELEALKVRELIIMGKNLGLNWEMVLTTSLKLSTKWSSLESSPMRLWHTATMKPGLERQHISSKCWANAHPVRAMSQIALSSASNIVNGGTKTAQNTWAM